MGATSIEQRADTVANGVGRENVALAVAIEIREHDRWRSCASGKRPTFDCHGTER